jgi:predicted CoA-binding protein
MVLAVYIVLFVATSLLAIPLAIDWCRLTRQVTITSVVDPQRIQKAQKLLWIDLGSRSDEVTAAVTGTRIGRSLIGPRIGFCCWIELWRWVTANCVTKIAKLSGGLSIR